VPGAPADFSQAARVAQIAMLFIKLECFGGASRDF